MSTLGTRLALIRFRNLRALELVAEHGSVRKAADILCVTQPAASAMLNEVEELLGVQLFQRSRTGMTPLPALKPVLERIKVVENELLALQEDAAAWTSRHRQILRLGVLPRSMQNVMPKVFATIVKQHPDIEFSVTESTSDVLLRGLAHNQYDCVIGRMTRDVAPAEFTNATFKHETLYAEGMSVVAAKQHPLSQRKGLSLADTLGFEWVLPLSGSVTRNLLVDEFLHAGLTPPMPRIESANFLSNLSLVEHGTLLTVSPSSAAKKYAALQGISILDIKLSLPLPPISCIWRAERPLDGALAILLDELKRG